MFRKSKVAAKKNVQQADQKTNGKNATVEKDEWSELGKTAILAILIALIIRTFLFEPFNIPSGSMIPNLLVGDYLFVSKYSYGYSRYSFPMGIGGFDGRIMEKLPERGDVAVFKLPTNTSVDYIKRVVGLPGDTVQVVRGQLYINDTLVPRQLIGSASYSEYGGPATPVREYKETLPNGRQIHIFEISDNDMFDNTDKITIPQGHVFMMGDNRDNSRDSRDKDLVGFVPIDNLVGKAEFLFFSTDGSASIIEVWKWPFAIRWNRLFKAID